MPRRLPARPARPPPPTGLLRPYAAPRGIIGTAALKLDVLIDEASELVLGVDVRAGNAGDGEGAVPLLSRATETEGIEVATLLGDMAYSDGDVREAVEQAGATLVAKVPPTTNSGRFPKTEFGIDLEAGTVTCPAGQTTTDARRAKDHKGRPATMFYFDASTCELCPLRDRCTAGKGGRTIMVGRHNGTVTEVDLAAGAPVRALSRSITDEEGPSAARGVRWAHFRGELVRAHRARRIFGWRREGSPRHRRLCGLRRDCRERPRRLRRPLQRWLGGRARHLDGWDAGDLGLDLPLDLSRRCRVQRGSPVRRERLRRDRHRNHVQALSRLRR